jgi:AraC family transcriptional regulator
MAAAQRLGLGEYCGSSIRRRQANGFIITENSFENGLDIPLHEHVYAHFTVVLSGGFTEFYPGATLECPPGSILLVPAGRQHRDQIWPGGAHTLGIELSPKLYQRVDEATGVLREPRVTTEAQRKIDRIYAEFRSVDPASLLAIEALCMDVLVTIARAQTKNDATEPTWMPGLMEHLHQCFRDNISLAQVAEAAAISESHLARTFRRAHGCTVGEYIRWLRLEETKTELRDSTKSVAEIGVEAGFYDQAHYSRAFRAAYGVSPSAYRKTFGSS